MNVYLSSTFEDLIYHRQAVTEAIRKLGMNTIDVIDSRQLLETSLMALQHADIFVGIYASRYGDILKDHHFSLTERLYLETCERGIPHFIYIVDPSEDWANEYLQSRQHGAMMRMFMDRLQKDNPRYFTTPQDLAEKVAFDLTRFRTARTIHKPYQRHHFIIGMLLLWVVLLVIAIQIGPIT